MNTRTTVVTERGQVSIPAAIRKELGLKPGQALVWEKLSDRECLVRVPRKKKPLGAKAMLGFAARLRGEKGRPTAEWMAELRAGEK
ncbi:MAG: AbrB/MazE/SpoVT family DNA-binding domain-containing protein [Chthoniobacterales bacterium]|nr:AbrB/MazE/SpoVT family DNA-binding domain-containing protein [Chthoniobacterales bacterium]MBA3763263.1 AbrB/MazE/SpoVT family DNA-binding domain-containing protein [Chthoniobacterales bacterium]